MPLPNHDSISHAELSWKYTTYYGDGSPPSSGGWVLGSAMRYRDFLTTNSHRTPGFSTFKKYQLPWYEYGKRSILLLAPNGSYIQTSYAGNQRTVGEYTYNAIGLGMLLDRSDYLGWAEPESPSGRARAKVLDQIHHGKASAGVAMAEISKTAALVANTAKRIAGALMALRKAQFGKFLNELGVTVPRTVRKNYYRNLRAYHGRVGVGFRFDKKHNLTRHEQETRYGDFLAQTWLEYSYGWKPLLMDVYNHAEATADSVVKSDYWMRSVHGKAMTERTTQFTRLDPPRGYRMKIVSRMWSHIRIDYRLPHGYIHPAIAFGLTNPLLIAWELVPFSFIADWFYPVGDMLQRMSAHHGLIFHRGMESFRNILYVNGEVVEGPPLVASGVTYKFDGSDIQGSLTDIALNRYLMSDFPEVPSPKFKDPRSIAHGLSSIALLKSNFLHSGRVRL